MGIEDILEEGGNLYWCIRCGIGWEDRCTGGGEREVWSGGYWPCFRTCSRRGDRYAGMLRLLRWSNSHVERMALVRGVSDVSWV